MPNIVAICIFHEGRQAKTVLTSFLPLFFRYQRIESATVFSGSEASDIASFHGASIGPKFHLGNDSTVMVPSLIASEVSGIITSGFVPAGVNTLKGIWVLPVPSFLLSFNSSLSCCFGHRTSTSFVLFANVGSIAMDSPTNDEWEETFKSEQRFVIKLLICTNVVGLPFFRFSLVLNEDIVFEYALYSSNDTSEAEHVIIKKPNKILTYIYWSTQTQ